MKQQLRLWFVSSKLLERRTSGETRVDIVPPLQFIALAKLPAQQHDAPLSQRGKVDQTALKVLELNAETFEFCELKCQFREDGGIRDAAGDSAATLFGGFRGFFDIVAVA